MSLSDTRAATIAAAVLGTMLAWGCDDGAAGAGAEAVPAEGTTAKAQARAADTGASYADQDLPVPPDFEAQADEQITEQNYEQRLEELEEALGEKRDAGADASVAEAGAKPVAPPSKPPARSTAAVKTAPLPKSPAPSGP